MERFLNKWFGLFTVALAAAVGLYYINGFDANNFSVEEFFIFAVLAIVVAILSFVLFRRD